ncbi:MAG: nickel pincer cofactor biosynthesis protein LarC [Phascolarctobacterium sp.]|nr:nickel pincer cofactor biosynthesis protein LarC [Phascolarctobacterium sp.]
MKKLYLECNAGISGDMLVAALIDLGADQDVLKAALDSIPAQGFKYAISRVKKVGVDCCDFDVILDAEHENHDHDMEYLHGAGHEHEHHHEPEHHHEHKHEHHHNYQNIELDQLQEEHEFVGHVEEHMTEHDHEHVAAHSHGEGHAHEHVHEAGEHLHDHEHGHYHEHEHDHEHTHEIHMHGDHHEHHHHHEHRGLNEVLDVINRSNITDNAKELATKIFDIVADAESKAHAAPKDQVHFHEVGAIDSIVDVIAIAVCFDNLGIDEVIIPKLCEGTGTIRCQHGILSVPVPATANIVAAHNLNLEIMNVQGEFVTPTGAAAAAALITSDKLPEHYKISKIGLGAGKRTYERPSILRAMLIETEEQADKDTIVKLESDIDDCTGEALGYVMDRLFAQGARDVHYMPIFMKKNRPAYELAVLCKEEQVDEMVKIIFEETTTIGVRKILCERSILTRSQGSVTTSYGEVEVKNVVIGNKTRSYPEYASVSEVAQRNNVPFNVVYNEAFKEN